MKKRQAVVLHEAETVKLAKPDDMGVQITGVVSRAKQIQVTDQASFLAAADTYKALGEVEEKVNQTFDPIIEKAHAAHKEAIAQKKRFSLPLIEAKDYLKTEMGKLEERPEVEGLTERELVSAEVFDFAALVKAAAENPQLVALLKPDQTGLNKMAQALGDLMNIPGVRAVRKTVFARKGDALPF